MFESRKFEELYLVPTRNGLTRPSKVRGSGIKMINMGELFAYSRINNPLMELVQVNEKELENFGVLKGDLLFARQSLVAEGAGKCSIVVDAPEPTVFESHLIRVRLDPMQADPNYYYYFFSSEIGNGMVQGMVMEVAASGIRGSDLAKIKVLYPPLTTQQRIASILSAYDDLIEVNNQRIKLLEQTARELYKEWFVRMRFPGFKQAKFKRGIPVDWKLKPIGKVIDYHIGGGWGNEKADNQFSVAGYVIRGTDIPKIRAGQSNPEVYRFHKASNMKSRQLIEGDIVFETAGGSEGQPLGRTCYITQEILDAYGDKVMAASFCKQIRTTSIPSLYLYYFLNYLYDTGMIETFQIQSTGISNYQFEPFLKFQEIILPDDDLMQAFHDKVMLMQKQIAILGTQNSKLREIRDRLLPRLISGKLEVKETTHKKAVMA